MILYTCQQKTRLAAVHPCGRAAKALSDAHLAFELRTVGGYRRLPWTLRSDPRRVIEDKTGQTSVPVLELDDGTVICGSDAIAAFARSSP